MDIRGGVRTHTPSTPVSTAILASSIWHRMCVRILAFKPSLQIASQSSLDCSEAAGLVNSIYERYQNKTSPENLGRISHIIHPEVVQGFCNFDFLGRVEESIGKLFALSQCALDDLESRYIAQEVSDGLVWVSARDMWVLARLDGSVAVMGCIETSVTRRERWKIACSVQPWPLVAPFEVPLACPLAPLEVPSSTGGHMVSLGVLCADCGQLR